MKYKSPSLKAKRERGLRFKSLEKLSLEDLQRKAEKMLSGNRGSFYSKRLMEVTSRYGLISSTQIDISKVDPQIYAKSLRRDISIMTGGYERQRARIFKDNLLETLEKLGANEQFLEDVQNYIKPNDLVKRSEDFQALYTQLGGYEKSDETVSEVLDNFKETIWDIMGEDLKKEYGTDPRTESDYLNQWDEWDETK